jgi:hypothetical protein
MRFTKKNRQRILDDNEGFTMNTSYSGRNYSESRTYSIIDGVLQILVKGKTSWADSRFEDSYTYDADADETKRFLRKFRDMLKLNEEEDEE